VYLLLLLAWEQSWAQRSEPRPPLALWSAWPRAPPLPALLARLLAWLQAPRLALVARPAYRQRR
jgi:hypothetical protein